MTGGTKGGAQRARSLRPRCFGVVDPETVTPIYLLRGTMQKLTVQFTGRINNKGSQVNKFQSIILQNQM
jgi:hypothetical protein